MRRALLLATAALAGCSGVPLATMWHYRNFGPEDFLKADPTQLQAAMQLDDGVELGNETPDITVRIRFGDQAPQKFVMPLEVVKRGPWVDAGAGKAEPGKHWYLFALTPAGDDAFRSLQDALGRHVDAAGGMDQHGSLSVRVDAGQLQFSGAERDKVKRTGRMYLQTRLELSPDDGFYTLYKGAFELSTFAR